MTNKDALSSPPETGHHPDPLKVAIAELLQSIPDTWVEFNPDALPVAQSQALFLIVAAGLVERRGWVRCEMLGHPTVLEARFRATGEGGLAKALEFFAASLYREWEEAYRARREEEHEDECLFHSETRKPHEWRLTPEGVLARGDLNPESPGINRKGVFDFVLKQGIFGPGHGFVKTTICRSPQEAENAGADAAINEDVWRTRPPVQGDGQLVEFRKVEKPAGPQAVTIANWNEGVDQLTKGFNETLQSCFEKWLKESQNQIAPSGGTPAQDAPAENPIEPTYLFCHDGAFFRVRFEGETGTIPTDLNGAKYIFEMLQKPNKIFPANELHAVVAKMKKGTTLVEEPCEQPAPEKRRMGADEGELKDLQRQLARSKEDLEHAQAENDNVKAAHCQEDIDAVLKRIREMTGLGGSLRETDLSERLGKSVAKSINLVIKKCKREYHLVKFAAHLDSSLERGRTCSYRPALPMPTWNF